MYKNSRTSTCSLSATWKEQKNKLLAKFPILTKEDLEFESGRKNEMLDNIQVKLGKTRDEMYRMFLAL